MLQREDVTHLAELARMRINEEETEALVGDLERVLAYVGEIAKVATLAEVTPRAGELRNVLREDADQYEGGAWSDAILANAPARESGFVKVRQIL